jgi:hypothetical protein
MRLFGMTMVGLLVGCSSSTDDDGIDASVVDATPIEDGGVRGLCPTLEMPECMAAGDCGEVNEPSDINCIGCLPWSRAVCTFGACESPEVLVASNPVNVYFNAESGVASRLTSFASAALTAETSGGATITCNDVYAGDIDLTNDCYNIVDSRRFPIQMTGDSYPAFFSRLPTERRVLLVLRGYEDQTEIGISCTEFDVGGPDGDGVDVEGDMMRLIR